MAAILTPAEAHLLGYVIHEHDYEDGPRYFILGGFPWNGPATRHGGNQSHGRDNRLAYRTPDEACARIAIVLDAQASEPLARLVRCHGATAMPYTAGVLAKRDRASLLDEAYGWEEPDEVVPDEPLLSTRHAAAILNLTPKRVRELAKSRGVGQQLGREWVFRRADIEAMRNRRPGRPRLVTNTPGGALWKEQSGREGVDQGGQRLTLYCRDCRRAVPELPGGQCGRCGLWATERLSIRPARDGD